MTRRRWSVRAGLTALVALGALVAASAPAAAEPTDPSPAAGQPRPEIIDPQLQAEVAAADASGEQIDYLVSLQARPDLAGIAFDREAVVTALKDAAQRSQAPVVDHLRAHGQQVLNTFWLANLVLARSSAESMTALTAIPGVEAIQPVTELAVPEPELQPAPAPADGVGPATVEDRTWGIDRIGAHRVWDELGVDGSGSRVAVLDTGVDISHPDLAGKMVTDDPDDPTFPGGWMEFDAAGQPVASNPRDSQEHGTHVSGTIAGGDNFQDGTAIGVAPGASLMHAMVLPNGSGTTVQVIAGMQWAVDPFDHQGNPAGQPADVVNMSLGPRGGGLDNTMVEPIRNMYFAGVMPVASAGNCNNGCHGSPGNIYETTAAGATDIDDNVASFSSGGVLAASDWLDPPADWPHSWTVPDVSAPGVDVISSVPPGTFPTDPEAIYGRASGTSMASPHTAGTAALLLSADPDLSIQEISDQLIDTSFFDDRYGQDRPNSRYGHGRINAFLAVGQLVLDSGVTGQVTDAEGDHPVAGVRVEAVEAAAAARTDSSGRYDLRVPPGSYTLELSAFGYQDATVPGVEVVEDRLTTVDAELEPLPTGTIAGTVTLGKSGHGVPGVAVQLPGAPVPAVTTGAAGAYTIANVPIGDHTVAAAAETFPAPAAQPVTVEPAGLATVDFALECGDHCSPDRLWAARFDGPGSGQDIAYGLGMSPDGATVYVTGNSLGDGTSEDYRTLAVDAGTGAELWAARYDGPASGSDVPNDLAVSLDGSTVYVTGRSPGVDTGDDYATVAYDAATGQERWVARYEGPVDRTSGTTALALTVSPDGATVYVTGQSADASPASSYATVAYDAATGQERWAARYAGVAAGPNTALAMDVSPDGSRIFVTGRLWTGVNSDYDYTTVGYDAATGDQLWVARYGEPGSTLRWDIAEAVNVSPDGSRVFVTGYSYGSGANADYGTVAYDAATGDELWAARYNGPTGGTDIAFAMAISPDGSTVYVTGRSTGTGTGTDYATVAYDTANGDERWVGRYDGPASDADIAQVVEVSPDGATVYVSGHSPGVGTSSDYATVAYHAEDGAERWAARYDGPAHSFDGVNALSVSPDGSRVFVTGHSIGSGTSRDYATVMYDATTGDEFPVFVPWNLRAQPHLAVTGAPVRVDVDVANVGVDAGAFTVSLLVDGEPEQATEVMLAPGEATQVGWTVTRPEPGRYGIQVGHLAAELRVVGCDETVTGTRARPLTVRDGVTCLAPGARVLGPVQVHEGAGLVSAEATVIGPLSANGADVVDLVDTSLTGEVLVRATTGSLVLAGNQVHGPVGLHDNATGGAPIVVSGNVIVGPLACTGNDPAPVNQDQPNQVTGRTSGQCDGL
ncbi:MAG: S8 family serine peptidase [Micromonosporaceae bacterium]|nr:S8 family serine peptidase [Micromonosporaceae bacterium]